MPDVKELKETVTLEMVSQKVGLHITNYNGSGRCPMCDGSKSLKTWNNSIFKCYKCDFKGDIFNLLIRSGKASSFKEAFSIVLDISGKSNFQHEYNYRSQSIEAIFNVYSKQARSNKHIVRDYFEDRGWDIDIINEYPVGLSLSENTLKEGGITKAMIEECEMYLKDKNNRNREYFDNHIIFPVYNSYGRLIHLNGRALDNRKLRWLSTRYTQGRQIHQYFYNSQVLYRKPEENKTLFLCEGVSDCVSLLHVTPNAIGQFGVNVHQTPYYKEFQQFDQIIAIFDNDKYAVGDPKEGQYKSWSQVCPCLIDLMYLSKTPIYYLNVPQLYKIKDLNDWLISINYDPSLFTNYVINNVRPLSYLAMDIYKDDIKNHDYIHKCISSMEGGRKRWFRYLKKTYGSLENYLIAKYKED